MSHLADNQVYDSIWSLIASNTASLQLSKGDDPSISFLPDWASPLCICLPFPSSLSFASLFSRLPTSFETLETNLDFAFSEGLFSPPQDWPATDTATFSKIIRTVSKDTLPGTTPVPRKRKMNPYDRQLHSTVRSPAAPVEIHLSIDCLDKSSKGLALSPGRGNIPLVTSRYWATKPLCPSVPLALPALHSPTFFVLKRSRHLSLETKRNETTSLSLETTSLSRTHISLSRWPVSIWKDRFLSPSAISSLWIHLINM